MRLTTSQQESNRGAAPIVVPPFVPHPWLRGGHSQTVVARYLGGDRRRIDATSHIVELLDGDRLLILESVPRFWQPSHPTALLVHGLAGSADAGYIVRVGERLMRMGIRVVRMNLRNAGDGFGLARGIYHAGRSDDLRVVATWLATRNPESPIGLVGFSLGANLVLKLASESASEPLDALDCVLAANPPIDLAACARLMLTRENRLYDWNFVRGSARWFAACINAFPSWARPP